MYTVNDTAAQGASLLDFPAPAGRVIRGAFDDAVETNPVPLFMLSRELTAANERQPRMQWWEAQDQAKRAGVKVDVPEEGISQGALSILIERRTDEAARSLLFARKEGMGATAGTFAAGFAGSLMDPVNAASGFIPVLSGTRYAAMLGKAATVGERAAVRAGIGAGEGFAGAAAVELPTIALRRDMQDEYGLYDSLANIAFGTFANTGLRMVAGGARDYWRGIRVARQEDFLRSIEPGEWAAARTAYEQQLERSMDQELRGGFDTGEGPSDGLRARWASNRRSAEIAGQADEAVGRMTRRMNEEEIDRFIDAEARFRAEAAAPGADERVLLDAAGVAERKFRELDLAEVRERLARGEGLIIVPGNAREVAAAVSDETHALALKAAVAQAVEGRQIDVDPILRQDKVFGPQRLSADDVRSRARANMAPESKVGADRAASERATRTLETVGPAAKPGGADTSSSSRSRSGEAAGQTAKSAELVEAEALLAEAKAIVKQAANDAGVKIDLDTTGDVGKKAETYDRAWQAVVACANGRGL